MANSMYNPYREARLDSSAPDLTSVDVKAVIVDLADYTFSAAHEFLSDIAASARVATSANLASKTITDGTFDAADVVITTPSGDPTEAIVVFVDTGVATTSNLLCFIDQGVDFIPNGVDVTIQWNASGIFG